MAIGGVSTSPADLVEREHELAVITRLLESGARGNGGVLIVQGPAGIGKTRLLEAARDAAGDELAVAAARGGELERDLPYGLVRQLFEPLVGDERQLVAGAAALARRALE